MNVCFRPTTKLSNQHARVGDHVLIKVIVANSGKDVRRESIMIGTLFNQAVREGQANATSSLRETLLCLMIKAKRM